MDFFVSHGNYIAYVLLMAMGLYGIISKRNLAKKIIGMNIFQTAIILFYVSIGAKRKATIPIIEHYQAGEAITAAAYINPLPHVLMLTAIVVAVATLGVALALLIRIHAEFGTIEEDEIIEKSVKHDH